MRGVAARERSVAAPGAHRGGACARRRAAMDRAGACGSAMRVAQDALEMRGIVRMHELARARQVEIVEAREPEPQRGRAQAARATAPARRGQRAHRLVGADERLDELGNKCAARVAVAIDAPVVDGDREIVGEEVGRGEPEVDDARHPGADEQHVVAEQVAVDRRTRQRDLAVTRLKLDLGGEQRIAFGVEVWAHRTRRLAPPAGAAPVGEASAIGRARRRAGGRARRRPRRSARHPAR